MADTQATPLKPVKRAIAVENSLAYMGSIVTFLVNADETGGGMAMMYAHARLGNEPPPHVHAYEHETYSILEGSSEFVIEGEEASILVGPGESIFLPAGKAHAQYIHTPEVRTLIIVSAATASHAVGMDSYFRQMAVGPATGMTPPPNANALSYSAADLQRFAEIAAANGLSLLAPEETAKRLPNYPGFGANPQADHPA